MTATFFKQYKVLLAIFVSVCIVGTAVGVATAGLTPSSSSSSTGRHSNVDTTHDEFERAGHTWEADNSKKESDEHGLIVESSQLKLPTNKRLRRQTNRLVRGKLREARAAEQSEAPTAGDADPEPEPAAGHNNAVRRRDLISCESKISNTSIPAAHITGHGGRPFARHSTESDSLVKGYQQRWKCCEYTMTNSHNAVAFVDGGMMFNQTDKTLRVPTCGYYHISSQIFYHIDPASLHDKPRSVMHLLNFYRNCSSWPEINPVVIKALSSVSGDDTTTHTSDVVHLCAGGRIWVEIPDFPNNNIPCCPVGDEQGTFLSAHLVAETACHWPPNIMMENLKQ